MTWYNSYTGFPYKHLGDDKETGIDCFNLCRLVFRNELNIDIPYTTSDYCNIVDEDWYTKTHTQFMLDGFNNPDLGWEKACKKNQALNKGLNMHDGKIVYKAVADTFGYKYFENNF